MRITLNWINFVSIILTIIFGSVTSTKNKLYIYDGKLSELNETPNGNLLSQDIQITINKDDSLNSDNADDSISNDFYTNKDNSVADLKGNENIKSDGNPLKEVSVEQQSSQLQTSSLNNGESPKRSKKRKSFPKRKKKRKRAKQQKTKFERIDEHRHQDEGDFILRREGSNYSAAENNSKSVNVRGDNEAKSTDKSSIVMEMVEAIIDNNYDVNTSYSTRHDSKLIQKTERDDTAAETTLREPTEPQLSREKTVNASRQRKVNRKDSTRTSAQSSSEVIPENEANRAKINKRLKQRKKFMTGDLSCMKSGFVPAPPIANANIKYIRNELFGIEKSFLEAEYHCRDGYKLIRSPKRKTFIKNKNLICKNRRWFGQRPACKEIKSKHPSGSAASEQQCDIHEAQRCEQLCIKHESAAEATCHCHKGFRLIGNRCSDIDECKENSNTDVCGNGKCINTLGSFKCECQKGFRVNSSGKCEDVNECFLRGGHGPCQDECRNTVGGYECSCGSLKGTKLANDGHSCEQIDFCLINNGGCSHTCLDTIGQAFCSCPEGYTLDSDWKTCVDIDECQLQLTMLPEKRCNYDCINLVGSFKCVDSSDVGADQPINIEDFDDYSMKPEANSVKDSYDSEGNYDIIEGGSFVSECSNGYYFNETLGDCQDINECEIDNGNCSNGTCVNTNGSFYCSCHKGFVMSEDDRYKCVPQHQNSTRESEIIPAKVNIACPPLFPPLHGYLECSRPVDNSSGTTTGRLKITNRPNSQCVLRCPTSYRASGTFIKTCGEDGNWMGDDDGICIKYPTPKLICPPNILAELPPFSEAVEIKIQRPKTDLNMKRDVTVKPSWVKSERIMLKAGALNVTYTARHPISKLTTSCTTTIYVVDGEPPTVDFCPPTQKYKIEKYHENVNVFWVEPKFSDNVRVTDVSKTNDPGSLFGLGSHQIIYEARDAAGFTVRCSFKVVVNAPRREGLKLPIENKNKFYN